MVRVRLREWRMVASWGRGVLGRRGVDEAINGTVEGASANSRRAFPLDQLALFVLNEVAADHSFVTLESTKVSRVAGDNAAWFVFCFHTVSIWAKSEVGNTWSERWTCAEDPLTNIRARRIRGQYFLAWAAIP